MAKVDVDVSLLQPGKSASGDGWSFDGDDTITLDSDFQGSFINGVCHHKVVNNGGVIKDGTFSGTIENHGTISNLIAKEGLVISGNQADKITINENMSIPNELYTASKQIEILKNSKVNFDSVNDTLENIFAKVEGDGIIEINGKDYTTDGKAATVDIDISALNPAGDSGIGWSFDGSTITLDSDFKGSFMNVECGYNVVNNGGVIKDGSFRSDVTNNGNISGGTFRGWIENHGTITNLIAKEDLSIHGNKADKITLNENMSISVGLYDASKEIEILEHSKVNFDSVSDTLENIFTKTTGAGIIVKNGKEYTTDGKDFTAVDIYMPTLTDGDSGIGWSFDGDKITLDSDFKGSFIGECAYKVVNNGGVIKDGTFSGTIENHGTITNLIAKASLVITGNPADKITINENMSLTSGLLNSKDINVADGVKVSFDISGKFSGNGSVEVEDIVFATDGTHEDPTPPTPPTPPSPTLPQDIDISTLQAGVEASGDGWSFDGSKITIQSSFDGSFKGVCNYEVINNGVIKDGTFSAKITNKGTITNLIAKSSLVISENQADKITIDESITLPKALFDMSKKISIADGVKVDFNSTGASVDDIFAKLSMSGTIQIGDKEYNTDKTEHGKIIPDPTPPTPQPQDIDISTCKLE